MRETPDREAQGKSGSRPVYYRDAERALKDLEAMLGKSHSDARDSVLKLMHLLLNKGRRIVLYLGAGCTMAVQVEMPRGHAEFQGKSWIDLLKGLFETMALGKRRAFLQSLDFRAERDSDKGDDHDIGYYLQYFDKLHLAWYLSSCFPNLEVRDREISKLVEPPADASSSSPLHEELIALAFDDIVTTNYDSHIARFLRRGNKPFTEITDSAALKSNLSEGGRRLFYLHGKAGQSRLIFDRFDYSDLMAERDGILDYVTYLLMDSHVIYVGFGLDDPTFNLMETRLQTLHGVYRPQSFAFIPVATEIERTTWQKHNLDIIDYGDVNNLPKILKYVTTTMKFVEWAEPQRKRDVDLNPREDRTNDYMADALNYYVHGKFKDSLLESRVALASTLFWERSVPHHTGTRILPFPEAARLCEIRIRMASNHYKLQWSRDEKEDHKAALEENEAVANIIIKEQREYLTASVDSTTIRSSDKLAKATERQAITADQTRTLNALENSLNTLKARVLYHKGQFLEARKIYEAVVMNGQLEILEKKSAEGPLPSHEGGAEPQRLRKGIREERRNRVLWKLRFAEGHFYSKCQLSRISYQLLGESEKGLKDRVKQVVFLDNLVEDIKKTCTFIAKSEPECKTIPEWDYYLNSMGMLHRIAAWTAGRHAVGVCKDVIPTKNERCEEIYRKLKDGIERLERDPVDLKRITWEMSQRWFALRYRYLCRGYALRWVVGREMRVGKLSGDADLVDAYRNIQKALHVAGGPGLERERMVNLLEAARLNVLAIFGERIANVNGRNIRSMSPLSYGAGLHYLDEAFRTMDEGWLQILGYRIASYFVLVSGQDRMVELERVRENKALYRFLSMDIEKIRNTVADEYRRFGKKLGDQGLFNRRIDYYQKSFDAIRAELKA